MAGMAVDSWLSRVDNDLATARTMLGTQQGLFLQIGLQCHQAIENLLTACYVKHHAPMPADTDSLLRMVTELPWKAEMDVRMLQTLEWLSAYPILESQDTRDVGGLAAMLTEDKSKELLDRTKELFEWIRSRL